MSAGERLMLPTRLLEEHEVDRDSMLAGRPAPGLEKVVAAVAERASHHLAMARARRREVGRRALPALLPAVLASRHLKAMRRSGFQVLSPGWGGQSGAGALTLAALLRRY
ncbi:MAG: squalene/phytoene synthase family protein [Rhodospirillales bacterium]|nr:squalene/phytoene synthase family protein [Rhodospirillales bacterium]